MENTYTDLFSTVHTELQAEYAKTLAEKLLTAEKNNWDLLHTLRFTDILSALQNTDIKSIALLLLLILTAGHIEKAMQKNRIGSAVLYILQCTVTLTVILSLQPIFTQVALYMRDVFTFLGVLLPTVGTLTAAGGNVAAATSGNLMMTIFLSAMQLLLQSFAPAVFTFFCGMAVLDSFSGENRFLKLSAWCKNLLFSVFSFVLAIFLILLHTRNIAAVNTDTASARTLRLMVTNAVPIVGGTIGEALRYVSAGLLQVKNAVGSAAVVFLLGMYLPIFFVLFLCGIALSLLEFFCNYFSIQKGRGVFVHMKYAIDFVLASYSAVFVIAIIAIGIFMQTVPVVSA